MPRKKPFGDQTGNTGPLKWTVAEVATDNWSLQRNSKSNDSSGVADLYQEGYANEDDAMQELWNRKERNAVRMTATANKLSREDREQKALKKAIGTWTPPVVDPEP